MKTPLSFTSAKGQHLVSRLELRRSCCPCRLLTTKFVFLRLSDLNWRGSFDARILETLVRGIADIIILLIYFLRSRRLLERVEISNRHSCKRVGTITVASRSTRKHLQKYKRMA